MNRVCHTILRLTTSHTPSPHHIPHSLPSPHPTLPPLTTSHTPSPHHIPHSLPSPNTLLLSQGEPGIPGVAVGPRGKPGIKVKRLGHGPTLVRTLIVCDSMYYLHGQVLHLTVKVSHSTKSQFLTFQLPCSDVASHMPPSSFPTFIPDTYMWVQYIQAYSCSPSPLHPLSSPLPSPSLLLLFLPSLLPSPPFSSPFSLPSLFPSPPA